LKIQNCEFPEDLFFDTENDVWLKVLSDGIVRIGITSILSFLSGWIERLNLKSALTEVTRGQLVATIESPMHFSAVRTPVAGKVLRFNPAIQENPKLINSSPYGDGWIAEIENSGSLVNTSLAKGPEAVAEKLQNRIKELRVHCYSKLPNEEMFAVGIECAATLANLDDLLAKRPVGTVIHIVSDDPFAEIEMVRWADQRNQILLETSEDENKLYHFLVEKKNQTF
jgi:glycine cleavage system H protein